MEKWTVTEASRATGLSESTFTAYFSSRGISTKKGITLYQILEVLNKPRRDCGTNNAEKVKRLVEILHYAGYDTPYTLDKEK